MLAKLQYISQGQTIAEQSKNILKALDGGCQWIQLRFKEAKENDLLALAWIVKEQCAGYKATFIVNDHVAVARETGADGVHLGLEDMAVDTARNILGSGKIIGGTANNITDVLRRVDEGCDYIGLGPFRFTATKKKLSPLLGLEGYGDILSRVAALNITTLVYAIGGIELNDIPALMETGIHGIAVSGLITRTDTYFQLIEQLNKALYADTTNSR